MKNYGNGAVAAACAATGARVQADGTCRNLVGGSDEVIVRNPVYKKTQRAGDNMKELTEWQIGKARETGQKVNIQQPDMDFCGV